MAGTLRRLTSLLCATCGPLSHQFTIHEDDLCTAILALATCEAAPIRPLGLAHPEPVQFEQLLRAIAQADNGREVQFISTPWRPVYWCIRAVEHTPIPLPIRADSLLGLVRPAPSVPNSDDVRELGVDIRPFRL